MRFERRKTLLAQVDHHFAAADRAGLPEAFSRHSQKAMDLLHSTAARTAFDLASEPVATRDRYGRSRFAQSVLLARRLVEAGIPLVQINWPRMGTSLPNQGGW